MSEVQDAIVAWKQCKADQAQSEAESRSLTEKLAQQKREEGNTNDAVQRAQTKVSNALNKTDIEQARADLAQAQQAHEDATALKDNLERALTLKPYEIQKASEAVGTAYKAIWKAKRDELSAEIQAQRDLIVTCLVVSKQADGTSNLGYIIQQMIGGEFQPDEIKNFTDQLTQEMGLS